MIRALASAHALLLEAEVELENAVDEVPAYCSESCRFLKAELRYVIKRLGHIGKVVGQSDGSRVKPGQGVAS